MSVYNGDLDNVLGALVLLDGVNIVDLGTIACAAGSIDDLNGVHFHHGGVLASLDNATVVTGGSDDPDESFISTTHSDTDGEDDEVVMVVAV